MVTGCLLAYFSCLQFSCYPSQLHNFFYATLSYHLPVSCVLPRMCSSFARHHSETTCPSRVTPIVSACSFKEDNFTFDTLGQEFASCVKFIQFALICSFLTTYPRHSLLAHISFPSNLLSRNQYFLMYNMYFTLL